MMYGEKNRKKEHSPSQEEHEEGSDGGSFLDSVHSIMNSIDDLKPLYKKISPFLNQGKSK
ncbi:hypothetical protein FGG79_08265 [Bacillus sp. BHET2]|nr:hypothetical protein FGG79_08265 [Bacillus sp. BHET2]